MSTNALLASQSNDIFTDRSALSLEAELNKSMAARVAFPDRLPRKTGGENSPTTKDTSVPAGPIFEGISYTPTANEVSNLFVSSQEWDGVITDMFDVAFRGILYTVSQKNSDNQEIIEIPLEFVNDADRAHIGVGSIFRLATGRQRTRGQIRQATEIYFRRAASRTKTDGPRPLDFGELFTD